MKFLKIDDGGFVWHIPLEKIADNRAKYYAERDSDTTYEEEFSYAMEDRHIAIDWFLSNMDYDDVEEFSVLVAKPAEKKAPFVNGDGCSVGVVEV